jgi:hypothetical protein
VKFLLQRRYGKRVHSIEFCCPAKIRINFLKRNYTKKALNLRTTGVLSRNGRRRGERGEGAEDFRQLCRNGDSRGGREWRQEQKSIKGTGLQN